MSDQTHGGASAVESSRGSVSEVRTKRLLRSPLLWISASFAALVLLFVLRSGRTRPVEPYQGKTLEAWFEGTMRYRDPEDPRTAKDTVVHHYGVEALPFLVAKACARDTVVYYGHQLLWSNAPAFLKPHVRFPLSPAVVRGSATELIGRIGFATPEVMRILTNNLADPSSYSRTRTVKALGQVGRSLPYEAVEPILARILAIDPDSRVKKEASAGLDLLADKPAGPLENLHRRLLHRDVRVRHGAAKALDLRADSSPRTVYLLALALQDVNGDVRLAAASALGKSRTQIPTVLSELKQMARKDVDYRVKQEAAYALAQLEEPESSP